MANEQKKTLLKSLSGRFGELRQLQASKSLFVIGQEAAHIYLRYSRLHERRSAFFGLRKIDLAQLEGRNAFICFFTDDGFKPHFVPYADFEQVLRQSPVAADGQYKVQVLFGEANTRELYIPHVGRFNIDGYAGIDELALRVAVQSNPVPLLTHAQVQTLLGAIGHAKGFSIYVPTNNAAGLDWTLTQRFHLVERLPQQIQLAAAFSSEIDVIWLEQSSQAVAALFEVEHSTPFYSGLLRFNDLLLTSQVAPRFFIVSNEARRDLFAWQAQRPTFQRSGLSEITSFLDYSNVFAWHRRLLPYDTETLKPLAAHDLLNVSL